MDFPNTFETRQIVSMGISKATPFFSEYCTCQVKSLCELTSMIPTFFLGSGPMISKFQGQ